MYYMARLLLKAAVVLACYSLLLMGLLGWPWSGVLLAGGVFAVIARRRSGQLTTLGSAQFAETADLERAGMLRSSSGLILGRIQVWPDRFGTLWKLFRWRIRPKDACDAFFGMFKRVQIHTVRACNSIHTAVFAPTGQGKAVSLIVPFLRTCRAESCCIIDFKGELAKLTGEFRRKVLGQHVVLLDPYHVVTDKADAFNPLDFISADDPHAIDQCNDLAKALVVRTADEEPHWNENAEAVISAFLAFTVLYGDRNGLRSLQTVRDLISHPERYEMAIKAMCESDAWNGLLARKGGNLLHFVDREKASILSTVSRHLRFLDTPAVAAVTQHSTFDPADLLTGKMSIYLILPPEHMRANASLLRMWVSCFMTAIVRRGLQTKKLVHFILDEAASLGHLEIIEDALDKFRAYGIRCQFYFQAIGQLQKCFPNGQDQTMLSNTTQIFFAVNDTATAEMVSNRLGEHTIIVESGGSNSGSSWQQTSGMQHQTSSSQSYGSNSSWQQQSRRLLKLDEVIALPPRVAITFTPGVPPICTTLLRYYEEPWLLRSPGWFTNACTATRMFAASLILFGASAVMAIFTTMAVSRVAGM